MGPNLDQPTVADRRGGVFIHAARSFPALGHLYLWLWPIIILYSIFNLGQQSHLRGNPEPTVEKLLTPRTLLALVLQTTQLPPFVGTSI